MSAVETPSCQRGEGRRGVSSKSRKPMSSGGRCRERCYSSPAISMGQAWRKRQDAWVPCRRRKCEWQHLQVQVVINRIRQASMRFACALDAGLSNEYQERANEMAKSVQTMERRDARLKRMGGRGVRSTTRTRDGPLTFPVS